MSRTRNVPRYYLGLYPEYKGQPLIEFLQKFSRLVRGKPVWFLNRRTGKKTHRTKAWKGFEKTEGVTFNKKTGEYEIEPDSEADYIYTRIIHSLAEKSKRMRKYRVR